MSSDNIKKTPELEIEQSAEFLFSVLSGSTSVGDVKQRLLDLAHQGEVPLILHSTKIAHLARLADLGAMVSELAHELNSPLNTMLINSEFMEELLEEGQAEKAQKMAKGFKASVLRMAQIIQTVRGFSRKDEEREYVSASVTDIISMAHQICSHKFKKGGVEFEINLPNPNLKIECRDVEIAQVLVNLLQNANDAASISEQPWIRVDVKEQSKSVTISVTDSGQAISSEARQSMFVPYFTTKSAQEGSGLGLYISRKVIQGHNGRLEFDSDCENTKFVITLPKQQTSLDLSIPRPEKL